MPSKPGVSGYRQNTADSFQIWNSHRETLRVAVEVAACEYHNLRSRSQAGLRRKSGASDWSVGIKPLSQIVDEPQIIREYHQVRRSEFFGEGVP